MPLCGKNGFELIVLFGCLKPGSELVVVERVVAAIGCGRKIRHDHVRSRFKASHTPFWVDRGERGRCGKKRTWMSQP